VDVTVLEKHADFLRDFRGDTVHPSTLAVIDELGLLERFLSLPHQKVERLGAQIGETRVDFADFTHLPGPAPYLVLMPQWDLLDFLAAEGARYDGFRLLRETDVVDLVEERGAVRGVVAQTPQGALEVRADLVIAADGRSSTVRTRSGLPLEDHGAPIDVLWFRLSRRPDDADGTGGRVNRGNFVVMISRGDFWQCAYVIAKGGLPSLQAAGLDAFRTRLAAVVPFEAERFAELRTWEDIKLLNVQVNRLREWSKPGLLCIGDAAHAMSPIGGVGINLAVQDAVATANLLAAPLRRRTIGIRDLRAVQARRMLPTRLVQSAQVAIQELLLAPLVAGSDIDASSESGSVDSSIRPPLPLRVLDLVPALRRIPARMIGFGPRPEHVSDAIRRGVAARSA
jgi:2-polyprenyl-6-methoxyphenol hydroxylase-like FAD-dependent oxidoreductase